MASAFATLEELLEALLTQHVSAADIKQILENQAALLKGLDNLKTAWEALKADMGDVRAELVDVHMDVLGIAQFLGAAPAAGIPPEDQAALDRTLMRTKAALDQAQAISEHTHPPQG